jgi:hypothetical protein
MFFILFVGFGLKTENPAIDWQSRGFLKNLLFCLEFHSHDAQTKALAQPNRHASIGLQMLQSWYNRGFHFLTAGKKHYFNAFVKSFLNGKIKNSRTCRAAQQW